MLMVVGQVTDVHAICFLDALFKYIAMYNCYVSSLSWISKNVIVVG